MGWGWFPRMPVPDSSPSFGEGHGETPVTTGGSMESSGRSEREPGAEWREQMVEFGVRGAAAFQLPKSVGQLFGLIFGSARPLCLDDCVDLLGISRGSASMGLNFLLEIGAIEVVEVQHSRRRTHYGPETSLRRLLTGILDAKIAPHLRSSMSRLDGLEVALESVPPEDHAILAARLKTLRSWRRKGATILPVVEKILGFKS